MFTIDVDTNKSLMQQNGNQIIGESEGRIKVVAINEQQKSETEGLVGK